MIPVVLALQLLVVQPLTTVTYDEVPVGVEQVALLEWPALRAAGARTSVTSGRVRVRGAPRRSYVVMLARGDGAYLVDGPFVWPDGDSARRVSARWHRTLRGEAPAEAAANVDLEWLRADARPGPWPMCRLEDQRRWSCWGMVDGNRGVLVLSAAGSLFWAVTDAAGASPLRRARWGRLLVVGGAASTDGAVRVACGYPVAPASGRLRGIRLQTMAVAGTRVVQMAPRVVWLTGDDVPPKAWVEVRTDVAGPAFLAMQDVAAAPPSVPLHVALPERRLVDGRVISGAGAPAPGTLLTVFRLIDPLPAANSLVRDQPRRVLAVESTADDEGRFEMAGIGEGDYELVAWHSQFGRVSVALDGATSGLVIRLRATGVARGRVLVGGRAAPGVPVVSMPEPVAFSAAEDIIDLKGGDASTAADGRFSVVLPASGGGELRIGGGTLAVRRVPLPRGPVASLDLGDLELGSVIPLTLVLDRDPGCEVRATGPVGRTGLQIVPAARIADASYRLTLPETGVWEFSLRCAGATLVLSPALAQIDAGHAGKEVRFVVR